MSHMDSKEKSFITKSIHFDFDSVKLKRAAYEAVVELGKMLSVHSRGWGNVVIEGHADALGEEASNQTLSKRRAQAVRDLLLSQGVDSERIRIEGFGSTRLLLESLTLEANSQNRRVVLNFDWMEQRLAERVRRLGF